MHLALKCSFYQANCIITLYTMPERHYIGLFLNSTTSYDKSLFKF